MKSEASAYTSAHAFDKGDKVQVGSVACLGSSLGAMPASGPGMGMALAPGMPCAPDVVCAEPSKPELGGTGASPAPPAGPLDSPPEEQGDAECCSGH